MDVVDDVISGISGPNIKYIEGYAAVTSEGARLSTFPDIPTRGPSNWWDSSKCDVTQPTATVVNACYHLLRKRSCNTVHRLALTN